MEGHDSVCGSDPMPLLIRNKSVHDSSKFVWEIDYDTLCNEMETRMGVHSPIFRSGNRVDAFNWRVKANFIAKSPYNEENDVILQIYDETRTKIPVIQYNKYSIPSIRGKETYTKTFVNITSGNWNTFIAMKDLRGFVSGRNNTVTIVCEVTAYGEPVHYLQPMIETPVCHCENLGRLFESNEFSDVTIITSNNKEIRAHRAILATASTVFSAMFRSEMMENEKNRVDIIDVEPEVVEEMVRFVYTGKTVKLEEMSFDLLAAAEKYDLQKLKFKCEAAMCKNLSVENSMDVLMHADQHQAETLRENALDFIIKNFGKFKETENYKTMIQSHGSLLGRLLDRMYEVKKMNT